MNPVSKLTVWVVYDQDNENIGNMKLRKIFFENLFLTLDLIVISIMNLITRTFEMGILT